MTESTAPSQSSRASSSPPSDRTSAAPAGTKRPLYLAVVAFPLLCTAVGFVALPRPVTTDVAREKVDRSALDDVVSKDGFSPPIALDIEFERLRLEGAKLPTTPVKSNGVIDLEFFFEATKEMNRNWQMFLHIDRKGQSHRIHGDHYPAAGRYSTTLWRTGEHVRDHWSGEAGNAPAGTYEVWLGFYIGKDRMKYKRGKTRGNGKDNRILVGTFEIVPK